MATGLLIILSLAVLATATARATRPQGVVGLCLAAALIAYAWLVVAALALSLFDAFDAPSLAMATAIAAIAAVAVVAVARRRDALSDPLPWREGLAETRLVLGDPRVAALGIVVALSLLYALGLAVFTPPAEIDALAYHLPRAAFWVQNEAVGGVAGSQDARLDESPPGAEIAVAVTMLVAGGIRLAGLVQWTAMLVTIAAAAGVARRLGAAPRAATFAGLLVAPLPVIALQTPTGLNDVVAAMLVVLAVFFLLGTRRGELALAGIAVASLLLTKVTALVALPVLLAVALLALPTRLRAARTGATLIGAGVGSSWLLLAHSDTGADAVGGVSTDYHGRLDLVTSFGRWMRLMTQLLELPGAVGRDALLYVVAAVAVAVAGIAVGHGRRALLQAAVLVALTPLLVPLAELAARAHRKLWFELGRSDVAFLDVGRSVTAVPGTGSWFGAVGLVIATLGIGVAARRATWRRVPARGVLALAPLLWIAAFAAVLGYSPDEGRYAIPGLILGASATAPLLHRPTIAWWAVAVSATTLVLLWTHSIERPAGIRLLGGPAPTSVWTREDALALGPVRAMPETIRFASSRIPRDARLAIWPAPFPDPPSVEPVALLALPFFGPHLTRHVVFARSLEGARSQGAEWALLPRFLTVGCQVGWRRETRPGASFQAFRRDPAARCAR